MHDGTEDEIHTSHPHSSLRSLGSFEHIIDLHISRNPVQFSLAIELASPISPGQLARALALLQGTHPLLSVASSDPRIPEGCAARAIPFPFT